MTAEEPRAYQEEAVKAGAVALRDGGRGQVHMACGTGKTLVARRIADELAPGGLTVVACPSVALVAQTLAAWGVAAGRALAVCGDDSAADTFVRSTSLPCPATTDPDRVAGWLRKFPDGRRLVVTTYKSVGLVGQALLATGTVADLLVLDEAHHLAGDAAKQSALVHDDGRLPVARRLYMTATPRMLAAGVRLAGKATDLVGMDDPDVFGPVLYVYPFSRAIAEEYLDDYRLVVVGVTRPDVLALLRRIGRDDVPNPFDATVRNAVVQAALAKAAREWGLHRVVAFCPRVDDAAEFARTLPRTLGHVPEGDRPGGELYAAHVSGRMSMDQRRVPMARLAEPPEGGWTVLANARCLGEGVDVPALDGVVFTHPKRSTVDVIQAVGRALRRNPNGSGTSTVLVPILLPDDPYALSDVGDAAEYDTLWQVARALRAHDDVLAAELDGRRRELSSSVPAELPSRILVRLPDGYDDGTFLRHLTVRVVRSASSSWWEFYGAGLAYRREHGHLRVPSGYVTASGLRLGQWVMNIRSLYDRGLLPADRVRALDELGMIWDELRWRRQVLLDELRAYRAEYGHLRVPQAYVTPDGYPLGKRTAGLRTGGLAVDDEFRGLLDELGMVWNRHDARFQDGLAAACRFHAGNGHLDVPKSYVDPDGYRLGLFVEYYRVAAQVPDDRRAALDQLGIRWGRPRPARKQTRGGRDERAS